LKAHCLPPYYTSVGNHRSPTCQKVSVKCLNINVCPIPVKTDVGQVDLVLRLSDGTSEKNQIPNRAGTTDKSISTGIKYWGKLMLSSLFVILLNYHDDCCVLWCISDTLQTLQKIQYLNYITGINLWFK
jgi:hypothetical protein